MPKITPFLWFEDQAEEAARFYVSIFGSSRINKITRYGAAGSRPAGTVMTVEFELGGQAFLALNGGPHFRFSEAISFVVDCEDQAEVDRFWAALSAGGEPGRCGWLKDRYGLSWQIIPKALPDLIGGPDQERAQRAMTAMMQMDKLDIAKLQQAYEG